MAVSRVTRNYQVTVPREVREIIDIKVGDTLLFVKEGEDVVLKKIDKDLLSKGFGLWKTTQEKRPWLMNKFRKEAERRIKRIRLQ
jgi:antitoxin PrlF